MPRIVIYTAFLMLLIGTAPLPYGYYTLLRLVATGVFFWAATTCYKQNNKHLPWLFGLVALLFNPIFKIHFSKDLWTVIDVTAAIILIANRNNIQEPQKKNTYKDIN